MACSEGCGEGKGEVGAGGGVWQWEHSIFLFGPEAAVPHLPSVDRGGEVEGVLRDQALEAVSGGDVEMYAADSGLPGDEPNGERR